MLREDQARLGLALRENVVYEFRLRFFRTFTLAASDLDLCFVTGRDLVRTLEDHVASLKRV